MCKTACRLCGTNVCTDDDTPEAETLINRLWKELGLLGVTLGATVGLSLRKVPTLTTYSQSRELPLEHTNVSVDTVQRAQSLMYSSMVRSSSSRRT